MCAVFLGATVNRNTVMYSMLRLSAFIKKTSHTIGLNRFLGFKEKIKSRLLLHTHSLSTAYWCQKHDDITEVYLGQQGSWAACRPSAWCSWSGSANWRLRSRWSRGRWWSCPSAGLWSGADHRPHHRRQAVGFQTTRWVKIRHMADL